MSNGLPHAVERFGYLPLSGHVTPIRGERSALAEVAANILSATTPLEVLRR